MDATDRQIIKLLMANGRMSNAALAAATSTAESTSHARVQALREAGVITGIHANVDTAAIGRPLQALIFVKIHPGLRDELVAEADRLAQLPPVLHVIFLGGHCDFVVWVAMGDPTELRDFVLRDLSNDKAIASTETCVIMEHRRGQNFDPTVE
ncbi:MULTISPECIES: Lrp/AsnC family transcriptional regulator [unclassified Luteococcus]|uniref:Lrp/AsnC family transcriptional regulator n=1 Tax=unclassified Luteococcus TaxID=2639923 RepID=UPI00313B85F3